MVFGSVGFSDWTAYEKPKTDILIKEIKEGKTLDEVTKISKQHQFPDKLISHPGEKIKLVEIIIPTSGFDFEANAKAQEHQGIQNLNMYAEKQIIEVKKSAIFQDKELTVFNVESNSLQIDKDSMPSEHLELSDTSIYKDIIPECIEVTEPNQSTDQISKVFDDLVKTQIQSLQIDHDVVELINLSEDIQNSDQQDGANNYSTMSKEDLIKLLTEKDTFLDERQKDITLLKQEINLSEKK